MGMPKKYLWGPGPQFHSPGGPLFSTSSLLRGQDALALTADPPHHDEPVGVMGTVGYHHRAALPSLPGLGKTASLNSRVLPLLPPTPPPALAEHLLLLLPGAWDTKQRSQGVLELQGDERFPAVSVLLPPPIPSPAAFVRLTVFQCAPSPLTLRCCCVFMEIHL